MAIFPFVLLLSGPPLTVRKDPTDNTILVYRRSRRWEERARLAAHTDNVSSLAISPCGQYLASAAWDGKVSEGEWSWGGGGGMDFVDTVENTH